MDNLHLHTELAHSVLDQGRDNADGNKKGLSAEEADLITQRNQAQSPLLRLPRELRDMIATYALSGYTINIMPTRPKVPKLSSHAEYTPKFEDCNYNRLDWLHLAGLTLACRQLNAECALLPYSLNTFRTLQIQHCNGFSERQCAAIRHIVLMRRYWTSEGLECLRQFEGVKRCTVWLMGRQPLLFSLPLSTIETKVSAVLGEGVVVYVDTSEETSKEMRDLMIRLW